MTGLRATAFHARASALSRDNAWITRNGTTLALRYESTEREALAMRLNVGLVDISWRRRTALIGARAEECLSRLMTRDAAALKPGEAFKALWLDDAGGVRGAGVLARFGKETFQLVASAADGEWIARAASRFDVEMRDVSEQSGGLAVVGPYARATLEAAGLDASLEPQGFRTLSWMGLEVLVSRFGEHGGYEIWCEPDDGFLVWDRILRAGEAFGMVPAGVAAADILDLEAGIVRPALDYQPARGEGTPMPAELGLVSLIDPYHKSFNGRGAYLAQTPTQTLVGIAIESDTPAPFAPLLLGEAVVGHTLRSVRSPALRRAIATAKVDIAVAAPGTELSLPLPPDFAAPGLRKAVARVAALPFLPAPASIGA